jgi:hypothetical protein
MLELIMRSVTYYKLDIALAQRYILHVRAKERGTILRLQDGQLSAGVMFRCHQGWLSSALKSLSGHPPDA